MREQPQASLKIYEPEYDVLPLQAGGERKQNWDKYVSSRDGPYLLQI